MLLGRGEAHRRHVRHEAVLVARLHGVFPGPQGAARLPHPVVVDRRNDLQAVLLDGGLVRVRLGRGDGGLRGAGVDQLRVGLGVPLRGAGDEAEEVERGLGRLGVEGDVLEGLDGELDDADAHEERRVVRGEGLAEGAEALGPLGEDRRVLGLHPAVKVLRQLLPGRHVEGRRCA